jgi:hypothetical protein
MYSTSKTSASFSRHASTNRSVPHPVRTGALHRLGNPDVRESYPGVLANFRKVEILGEVSTSAATPPAGFTLVTSPKHEIGARDMVFSGGTRSYWMPARRAGEIGSLIGHSVAVAVATPNN